MTTLNHLAPAPAKKSHRPSGDAAFVRVTVMGTQRCADMSIGSDVPLGVLLPDLVAAV